MEEKTNRYKQLCCRLMIRLGKKLSVSFSTVSSLTGNTFAPWIGASGSKEKYVSDKFTDNATAPRPFQETAPRWIGPNRSGG